MGEMKRAIAREEKERKRAMEEQKLMTDRFASTLAIAATTITPRPAPTRDGRSAQRSFKITSARSIVPATSRLTEDFALDSRTREPQSIVHLQQGTDPQHDPHR